MTDTLAKLTEAKRLLEEVYNSTIWPDNKIEELGSHIAWFKTWLTFSINDVDKSISHFNRLGSTGAED